MHYQMIVDIIRARYNTSQRGISLQSEVDSLSFDEFMARHQIQDEQKCIRWMVEYLNKNIP